MLWIFVIISFFVLFGTYLGIILEVSRYNKLTKKAKILAIIMAISFGIGVGGIFGLIKVYDLNYEEIVQTGDFKLVSMTDNGILSGKDSDELYYICISTQTYKNYLFYYQLDDGEIKKVEEYADNIAIILKNDCTPHVIEYTTYTKNRMDKTLKSILTFNIFGETSWKTYKVYIPAGTIFKALDSQ